jgi:hypothetical protein
METIGVIDIDLLHLTMLVVIIIHLHLLLPYTIIHGIILSLGSLLYVKKVAF